MLITGKPELVKDTTSNKISYIFKILSNQSNLNYVVELTDKHIQELNGENDKNLINLLPIKNENNNNYRTFLQTFIEETRQYFSKKYTVEIFMKIINHAVNLRHAHGEKQNFKTSDTLTFYPESMVFINQGINLVWSVEHKIAPENILITLPDIQDSNESDKLVEIHDLNDLNTDIAEDSKNFEMPYEQLSREVALSKVREARLKARLAYVHAKISTDNYLKKYGDLPNDFEESDFEDEDDDEDENDEDDEDEGGYRKA